MIVLGTFGGAWQIVSAQEMLPTFEQGTHHADVQRRTSVPVNIQICNTNAPIPLVGTFSPT